MTSLKNDLIYYSNGCNRLPDTALFQTSDKLPICMVAKIDTIKRDNNITATCAISVHTTAFMPP